MEFPAEEKLETNDSEYMFGSDLLVAPKPDTFGPYEVKLPEGIWYDYWTGLRIEGKPLQVDPALDQLPVYVRGGAIVPRQALIQNVEQVPQGPLTLVVYPGPNCQGSVYADDGNTFAYTHGEFFRQEFTCKALDKTVSVHLAAVEGTYHPWWKAIEMKVLGALHAPTTVTVDGTTTKGWRFDEKGRFVTLVVPTSASDVTLNY
jgi:alpha-glucosidase